MKAINAFAPCRINDIGGWTDTRFAKRGRVSAVAVKPGVHVQVTERPWRGTVCLYNYTQCPLEYESTWLKGNHPLVYEAIRVHAQSKNLEIGIYSDMPPGASTGTSAAMLVALIGALTNSINDIAQKAYNIENGLGYETGVQDQVMAQIGRVADIYIQRYPYVVSPMVRSSKWKGWRELDQRLMLVYLGKPHSSSEIHKRVIAELGDEAENDHRICALRELATEASKAIGLCRWTEYGDIMGRNTAVQISMHADLVPRQYYDFIVKAKQHGALGVKMNGAGGDGGSMTVLTDGKMESRQAIGRVATSMGYQLVPISICDHGLQVWESDV